MFGFLRETSEDAKKCGIHKETGLCRTGLDEYLNVIFPDTEWIHDKPLGYVNGVYCRKRPDYRCESLKLIVEFDGLPHYQNIDVIINDENNTLFYEHLGYTVVRIPYFIQLTNKAVETLFHKTANTGLFPENVSSFSATDRSLPSYCCISGLKRMAKVFKLFPEQYELNMRTLKSIESIETDYQYLEYFYNNL